MRLLSLGLASSLFHWFGPYLFSWLWFSLASLAWASACFNIVRHGPRLLCCFWPPLVYLVFGLRLFYWLWPPLVELVLASACFIGRGLRVFNWLWPPVILLALASACFIGCGHGSLYWLRLCFLAGGFRLFYCLWPPGPTIFYWRWPWPGSILPSVKSYFN